MTLRVGIIGGTGYTGAELLRILVRHPYAELTAITSRAEAGNSVAELFPNLRGVTDLRFSDPGNTDLDACQLVFSATPNGIAMTQAERLLRAGVRMIDLAADFRIRDRVTWERWYEMTHACPALLDEAVYGLPELNRKRIRAARLVANPGCYPTAVILGALPLIEKGVVNLDDIIADAKSGVSGAGRSAKLATLFSEAADNFKAYGVSGHRHYPEIMQVFREVAGSAPGLTFVPHLVPMIRGIHATLYFKALDTNHDLTQLFSDRYAREIFVDVMDPPGLPETRSVKGANTCRIAVHQHAGGRVVVLSVIDNLVKGAAGQAIQNMNIMFDLDEDAGLDRLALVP
ncbi:MAG: N-acetyl-gamma-glutamyl-phosphate reductase [Gammaproteobacteria bacterium]|nr:N-acetyl-gamma-glutamyl-phosphate reductase [Gammaproteobacteria bacterium]